MYNMHIGPAAQADVEQAYLWHEDQRQGLGQTWFEAFENIVRSITAHPFRYPPATEGFRRANFRRFSYIVYYRVDGTTIELVGVFHERQSPDRWQSRFTEK